MTDELVSFHDRAWTSLTGCPSADEVDEPRSEEAQDGELNKVLFQPRLVPLFWLSMLLQHHQENQPPLLPYVDLVAQRPLPQQTPHLERCCN